MFWAEGSSFFRHPPERTYKGSLKGSFKGSFAGLSIGTIIFACTLSVQGLSFGVLFSGPEVAGVVAFWAEGFLILKFGV